MPTETEAWVVHKAAGPFELEHVTLDDPLEDEVLVEMVASGVCHTDLSCAKGVLPGCTYPVILGHEGAGRVKSCGSKVTSVAPGDSVLLSFAYCNSCASCSRKDVVACDRWVEMNFMKERINGSPEVGTLKNGQRVHGSFFGQSSFGKHALVRAMSCVKVPHDTNLELLASLGCSSQTGAGSVLNIAKPRADQSILIGGLGGVGYAALFAAKSLEMKTIIAVDLIDSRLEKAKQHGATHTINARNVNTTEEVMRLTNGKGVDFAIEATGVAKAAEAAFFSMGKRGKMVQIGDNAAGNLSLPLGGFLSHLRTIVGCAEGDSYTPKFIPKLVQMNKEGKFPLEAISKQYSWKDLQAAELAMHDGSQIKPILLYGK